MEQDFKTVLTQKVEEFEKLKKQERPIMTTEVAHKYSALASEIIKLIEENPEEAKEMNLEELSENLNGFLCFLRVFSLTYKGID